MGLRSAIVFCVTSFLLGTLFTHWIADSLTLWKSPITDEHLWTAATYYSFLARAPFILYFLTAVVALGAVAVLWSFLDGAAVNILFDGGSIFLFGTTIALYFYSVIPMIAAKFATLPAHQLKDPVPSSLRSATLDLASTNLMCSVALTGVMLLQAGRFWTERSDDSQAAAELRRQTALLRKPLSRAMTPEPKKAS
ncbi:hypothetical protein HMN09_00070500 [Mycena chlorophos]|uniref:Uncharacterized protein n=2 Tax=Mycena chlorophos TaxID=658473 RepID=A0ABQ0L7W0_MYCCL|nr:hypothetical protein HMN09_00070500 [Mycena chlorophos]GAT47239.1 predicted protein [Mycena chlorophos]